MQDRLVHGVCHSEVFIQGTVLWDTLILRNTFSKRNVRY